MSRLLLSSIQKFVLVAIAGLASTAFAEGRTVPLLNSSNDPNTIFVEQITVNGTGCPAGSVAANFSQDFTELELIFSDLVARTGPGTVPADWRKNCILAVTVHVPAGFTFALIGAEYRGFAHVDQGVTGMQTTTYFLAGQSNQITRSSNIPQDLDSFGNYSRQDEIPVAEWVWSRCGKDTIANLNASVSVDNNQLPNVSGFVTLSETTITPQVLFHWHFAWQTC
jgi:hypothetical protein